MLASRGALQRRLAGGEALYGINTGFGSFSRERIGDSQLREIQLNLVRSHAAGVGDPLRDDVVRAMMLVLAASLARGHSGARPQLPQTIIGLLNAGITPLVPSRGSVGASGDLAPLAHVALALIGEGEVRVAGAVVKAADALAAARIQPLSLEAKEGLSLINGTHLMSGCGALLMHDCEHLFDAALAAASMAVDGARASDAPLDQRIHDLRGQPGQSRVAGRMRELLRGSQIIPSHRVDDPRVQDPYCLRAAPQILGAAFDAIEFARGIIERELGAVTDNPLVFADKEPVAVLSGANFHGMPLAIALDTVKIALCHIAGVAERRTFWVLSGFDLESRLNAQLSPSPGLMCGLMIVQYTAAACCNEMQVLAHPASVGNISTSAGIEDYNSFGATSALHAMSSLDLAHQVVAIELLCMAQALEHHRPLRSGAGVERALAVVRSVVPPLQTDRSPSPDIAAIARAIREGRFAP